jgi:hypothetical protein
VSVDPAETQAESVWKFLPTEVVEPAARADIEHVVKTWQQRLHLDHWVVEVAWDKPLDPGETLGEMDIHGSYDFTKLKLAADYATWSRYDTNTIIVHELLHLTFRDLWRVCEAIVDHSPRFGGRVASDLFVHESEGVIDRMATCLVEQGGVV